MINLLYYYSKHNSLYYSIQIMDDYFDLYENCRYDNLENFKNGLQKLNINQNNHSSKIIDFINHAAKHNSLKIVNYLLSNYYENNDNLIILFNRTYDFNLDYDEMKLDENEILIS